MVMLQDNRARRLEAVDILVDDDGDHRIKLEDGSSHPTIVDQGYQRPLDQKKVEQIREDWDPVAPDALTLSLRRNGALAIVNGQHLIVAALLEGETCLLAEIFEGLSVPREADLRLKKNNQRPDTALEKFYARLAAERPTPGVKRAAGEKPRPRKATAIVKLLAEFDTQINRSPNRHAGINCVGTIERLYNRQEGGRSGAILRRTLRALKEAYGNLSGEVVNSPLIEGTAWFLTVHYGEYSWQKLINQMEKVGPAEIHDIARGFKRAMGGADWLNSYRALVEVYNRSIRRVENKLEMKTSRWTSETQKAQGQLARKVA